jgi:hypothetical protein
MSDWNSYWDGLLQYRSDGKFIFFGLSYRREEQERSIINNMSGVTWHRASQGYKCTKKKFDAINLLLEYDFEGIYEFGNCPTQFFISEKHNTGRMNLKNAIKFCMNLKGYRCDKTIDMFGQVDLNLDI